MVFPMTLYPIVGITTIVWLAVTFMTSPVDRERLKTFYRKVHPGGIGWKTIAEELPDVKSDKGFGILFVNWLFGVVLVYTSLFGIGRLIFQEYLQAIFFLALAGVSATLIYFNLTKKKF